MKNRSACGFIVVWDDNAGVSAVFGWDDDCDGALCMSEHVAWFATRQAAKTAINISVTFARLNQLQGKPHNSDFTDVVLKNVRIMPCWAKQEKSDEPAKVVDPKK